MPVLNHLARVFSSRLKPGTIKPRRHAVQSALVDCLPGVAVIFDTEGVPQRWNAALERVTGFDADEIAAMRPVDFVMPKERLALEQLMRATHLGDPADIEVCLRCKRGDAVPYQLHLSRQRIDGVWYVLLAGLDATDRHRAREQRLLAGAVFDSSHAGIMITDLELRIISVNPAFTHISGFVLEEVKGHKPSILSSGRHDVLFYQNMWRAIASSGYWQGEIWNRRKDGEVFPEWLTISAVRDADDLITHYVGVFSDISERKAAEQQATFLAQHDALTRLPNRTLLHDRVTQAISSAQRDGHQLALMYLDLDNFKTINDCFGHTVGDRLLLELAAVLQDCVRSSDTVSRQGGDEFVILLPQIQDEGAAAAVARKILTRLAEPMKIAEHTLRTSFSVGISVYPADGDNVETLCRHADAAMYLAKESGRNSFRFYTPDLDSRALEQLHMEQLLREALQRDELRLHYQPQIDLHTGAIVGVEALLRWNSAELGEVSPARFIPLAEQCGLIVPIGEWVLREACLQCRAWRDLGHALVMAVNLSAVQFRQDDLAEAVGAALNLAGLPGASLELELTESLLMGHTSNMVDTLRRVKALGVRLAIDDFGTGYSSLGYLKRFAVDQLKIDRSFVTDMTRDPNNALIVRSTIDLAHNLGLSVVAEGVEEPATLDALRGLACDSVQGYLLGHPLSAAALQARLAQADFASLSVNLAG